VVQVEIKISGGPPPHPYEACFNGRVRCVAGTGFFVNSDAYAITALHVVEGYRTKDGRDEPGAREVIAASEKIGTHAQLQIGVAMPNVDSRSITMASDTLFFPAKVVATDAAHDLALIQATVNPFKKMPTPFTGDAAARIPRATVKSVSISTTRPSDGEEIFACGYPLSSHGLISTSGTIASAWNTQVLLRAEAAGFPGPVGVYEVDLRMNPGNSGGPVFRSSDQAVIGVDVQTFGNLSAIVPAKFVAAFLDANKTSWQKSN
jgi:S1-C subfamily serine protease